MHRCFQSETIGNFKLTPDHNPRRVVLARLLRELTFVEVKDRLRTCKDLREQPGLRPRKKAFVWCLVAAVKEAVVLFVVAVQVAEDLDACRLGSCRFHVLLQEIKLRVHGGVWIRPPSVQVNSSERGPRVADDASIRIEHWN